MSTISGGLRDHEWLAAAAAHVARTVTARGLAANEHLGVVRQPTAAFAALVLGCLRSGATFTVLDPDVPVAPRFLGVSTVLDGDELLAEMAEGVSDESVPAAGWAAELGPGDRVALLSGLSAQIVSGVASAVAAGAALHLDSPPVTDPEALVEWLRAHEVTVVFTTAPVLRAIIAREERLPSLRRVVVENNGDVLLHDVDALHRLAPICVLACAYRTNGEGRPLATYQVPDDWQSDEPPLRLPLGTMPTGADVRLLTGADRPAAVGEVGELCVGSSRTGDLLRRWPDGSLEFVGHAGAGRDAVETVIALRDVPGVRDAVIAECFDADGEPELVAYVTGPDLEAGPAALRGALAVGFPDASTPAHVVVLAELPLTTAGDYDVDALPDPAPGSVDEYVAPRTPLEEELTEILRELLNAERIGVLDSFFEMGGFSLLATQLSSRISERFGIELSLREIFEAPTVDGLSQLIVRRELELAGEGALDALLDEIDRSEAGS